jgi:hypothetical protein
LKDIKDPNYWNISRNFKSIEFLNHFQNSILFKNIFIKIIGEYKKDNCVIINLGEVEVEVEEEEKK